MTLLMHMSMYIHIILMELYNTGHDAPHKRHAKPPESGIGNLTLSCWLEEYNSLPE